MIFLYLADISNLKINEMGCIRNYISSYRYEKISRYSNYQSKILSLAGELLLNYAIKNQFPEIQTPVYYRINTYGKPYLNDNNIFFNISHSGKFAICATSYREIGVDIEKIRDIDATGLSKKVFTESEKTYLKDSKNPREDFFRIWTLKESYMKARGVGFKIGFKNISVQINKNINVFEHNNKMPYNFLEPNPPNGYKIAVCQNGTIENCRTQYIDINELLL